MITITRFHEMLLDLQGAVNAQSPIDKIKLVVVSPTESHLINKLRDKAGIILAVKMPDADTVMESADNYSENNHCLFYLIEKVDMSKQDNQREREHYNKIQALMKLVKEWLMNRNFNGDVCGGEERLNKPFHTEWEYNTFGGFNGLSVSFDLEDFSL